MSEVLLQSNGERYQIDSEVPLPVGKYRMPFVNLKVGDSFLALRRGEAYSYHAINRVRCAVHWAKRKLKMRLVTRQTAEGLRVWRLPDDDTVVVADSEAGD